MAGLYLGNPLTGGMVALPNPDPGMGNGFDRNENLLALSGGGSAATRSIKVRQSWNLTWSITSQAEATTILGFYTGTWGAGPYAVMDPSWPNFLDLDMSLCGYRRGVVTGWTVPTGDSVVPAASDGGTPPPAPTAAPGSQVMGWTGADAAAILVGGSQGTVTGFAGQGEPVTSTAVPYVATEAYTFSVYARAASGTPSVTARVSGRNAAGTVHTNASGTSTALSSTAWTRVVATAAAGVLGAQFVIPTLACNTAAAPEIYLAAPQLELALAPSGWTFGMGAPRTVITSKLDTTVPLISVGTFRDLSLQLAEVG